MQTKSQAKVSSSESLRSDLTYPQPAPRTFPAELPASDAAELRLPPAEARTLRLPDKSRASCCPVPWCGHRALWPHFGPHETCPAHLLEQPSVLPLRKKQTPARFPDQIGPRPRHRRLAAS